MPSLARLRAMPDTDEKGGQLRFAVENNHHHRRGDVCYTNDDQLDCGLPPVSSERPSQLSIASVRTKMGIPLKLKSFFRCRSIKVCDLRLNILHRFITLPTLRRTSLAASYWAPLKFPWLGVTVQPTPAQKVVSNGVQLLASVVEKVALLAPLPVATVVSVKVAVVGCWLLQGLSHRGVDSQVWGRKLFVSQQRPRLKECGSAAMLMWSPGARCTSTGRVQNACHPNVESSCAARAAPAKWVSDSEARSTTTWPL